MRLKRIQKLFSTASENRLLTSHCLNHSRYHAREFKGKIMVLRCSSNQRSDLLRFLHTLLLATIFLFPTAVNAAVGGSISGTIKDATGGVVPGAMIAVTNSSLRTEFRTTTDARGYFSFPNLAVGAYDLSIEASGFKSQKRTGLVI